MDIEELLGQLTGRLAQGVRPNDHITRLYGRVMSQFGRHALSKWSAASAAGFRCAVQLRHNATGVQQPCGSPAAGPCMACGQSTCIGHSMASPASGDLLCGGCVARIVPGAAAPPPPREGMPPAALRARYLDLLGLEPGAEPAAIKRAFRELARKHHPDGKSGQERIEAEAHFKRLNEAYQWLMRDAERRGSEAA